MLPPQEAHEDPVPAIRCDSPLELLEKEANIDICRLPGFWQLGQLAASSALDIGRISSNLTSQALQTYS